jgi:hypothetical protein
MDDKQIEILEYIIESKGHCLRWTNCIYCPFAQKCFVPAVTSGKSLSSDARVNLAKDRITKYILIEDSGESKTPHHE